MYFEEQVIVFRGCENSETLRRLHGEFGFRGGCGTPKGPDATPETFCAKRTQTRRIRRFAFAGPARRGGASAARLRDAGLSAAAQCRLTAVKGGWPRWWSFVVESAVCNPNGALGLRIGIVYSYATTCLPFPHPGGWRKRNADGRGGRSAGDLPYYRMLLRDMYA